MPRLRLMVRLVGLVLLVVGLSMVGNAYFAQEQALSYSGNIAVNGTVYRLGFYAYLKSTDRLTITCSGNSGAGQAVEISLAATRLDTREQVSNLSGLGSLSSIFVPPTRGLYLFNASFESPDGQQGFNVTYLITSIGGEPSELLPLGLELTAAGSALAILSMPFVPLGRKASPNRPARRTGRASNGKARTVSLIGWELFGSRRVYLALMVLLATMFSAGAYNDEVVLFNSPVGYSPKPADLLAPTLSPTTDWLVTFPVIVAACAYSFSYERDSRVMRSVLLNPLGSARLFGAKALSVFLMALVPTAGAIAATIFMFDPLLSVREPLVVWANLWLWLVIYVLQICVMLGFAILPAVIFKKAFYAFVIPIFGYFLVYSEGFGITGRLPSLVWLAAVQSLAGYEIYFFSLRGVLLSFAPSLAVALACFLAAFFVFERQERE